MLETWFVRSIELMLQVRRRLVFVFAIFAAFRSFGRVSLRFLRFGERTTRDAAQSVAQLDAVCRGLHCDLARLWCDEFEMMCDTRCRFTSVALDIQN